ncbi:hypothetical protein [Thermoproteus tenax]
MKVQYDFPLVDRPFEEIGQELGLDEDQVIQRLSGSRRQAFSRG